MPARCCGLNDDGSVPSDNPFSGKAGYKPEIYTLGHRSTLALAVHPGTGELWENENGPNGGDEINVLEARRQLRLAARELGPHVSRARGSRKGSRATASRIRSSTGCRRSPCRAWRSTPADKLAKWKGDVFVGGMRMGEIPGTGHLQRILFNENMEELRREMLLVDLRQRIRDVRQGPDELLYLLTDEDDGAILRIEPAN